MLPVPALPRISSPQSEEDKHHNHHHHHQSKESMTFYNDRIDTLSPLRASFPAHCASSTENSLKNPFNFQTIQYTADPDSSAPAVKADLGRRRGHKYKHSSISYQIVPEPPPRPPLELPASLPVPTAADCWASMSKQQCLRSLWCICHILIAAYVKWNCHGSLAYEALACLVFYDGLAAIVCVTIEVLSNFDIWWRSSIKYPFGLQRLEVLASLSLSITLLFISLDLTSHGIVHALENYGNHEPHRSHSHSSATIANEFSASVDSRALTALVATIVSSTVLKAHKLVDNRMRFFFLPPPLNNPSHLLPLASSTFLLLLPHFSVASYPQVDRTAAGILAALMLLLSCRLVSSLSGLLLLSYNPKGSGVVDFFLSASSHPAVVAIEEAKFWQVNYGLCMANLKVRVRTMEGCDKVRKELAREIVATLGGVTAMAAPGAAAIGSRYDVASGDITWEISTELVLEKK